MNARSRGNEAGAFEHPALLYEDMDQFLSSMVPFIMEGLEKDEPVFAAVGTEELAALRAEFGPDTPGVTLSDTREWHPNTATRLRAFYEFVGEQLDGGKTRVRLVGEPAWPDGPPELVREWQRYESALNAVLAPFPATLVCTYPTFRLDPALAASARRTHPVVHGSDEGAEFVDPEDFLRWVNPGLPPPPPWATRIEEPLDPPVVRRFLQHEALRAGLRPERAVDFCIAANEVLTNALVHGGGDVRLGIWTENERLICQIEDEGDGVADPLAGYRPPGFSATDGRGLWIARQLADLVQVVSGSRGTEVRLHVQRAGASV